MNAQHQVELGFEHVFESGKEGARTLLLLHGTGGNEHDLLSVGRTLDPQANLLSPRGKVREQGMPRFFRRLAEGVFDEADIVARAAELAAFVQKASAAYAFDAKNVTAVGFSNGANIASALLLLHPGTLAGAALWRGMVPLTPHSSPDLRGKRVLIASGSMDPMVSAGQRTALVNLLGGYGATTEVVLSPAGHNLTQRDLAETQRWLATTS
jgi:phospholipase/carboxylesterase